MKSQPELLLSWQCGIHRRGQQIEIQSENGVRFKDKTKEQASL